MSYDIRDNGGRKIGTIESSSGCHPIFALVASIVVILGILSTSFYLWSGVTNLILHHTWTREAAIVSGATQSTLGGRETGNVVKDKGGVWLGNKGASVTFDIVVQGAGDYSVKLVRARHSSLSDAATVDVSVNGGPPIKIGIKFHEWDDPTNTIRLQNGKNTITLSNEVGDADSEKRPCNEHNRSSCTFVGSIEVS